ncbi:MAG TPA: tetratricopeptide repeat protein [Candidatus Acidoferrales bacterium]|nr:tetratricopeptide repeat protein [Candidatus Acidoferrales bacterium]
MPERTVKVMKHAILVAFVVLIAVSICAAQSEETTTTITGTILDKGGAPFAGAQIIYKSAASGRSYKVKTDKNGEFSLGGIPYDTYQVEIISRDGESVFKQELRVSENPESHHLLVDLSKPAATEQPKYTPGQVAAIREQNEKIRSMNALISKATNALNARNWQAAIAPLQELVAADPTEWQFYSALGDAQLNLGQYDQALESYEKGVRAAESNTAVDAKNPNTDPVKKKAGVGKMLTNEGNVYLKLHKTDEAVAAYTKAAALDPNPATAYFNLCATLYNTGNMDSAVAACDKAISADPDKADAYFIKGSVLYGNGKIEKDGKYTVPPGTVEALNKYLELAPNGAHVSDVRAMLEALGAKVETTYKPTKK